MASSLIIRTLPSPFLGTNGHLVLHPETACAVLVDAPAEIGCYVDDLLSRYQCQLKAVWLTHAHFDHVMGLTEIAADADIEIIIHRLEADLLRNPRLQPVPMPGLTGVTPTRTVDHMDTVQLADLPFTVLHTPGHTPGGVCYHSAEQGVVFTGDTLFRGTIGRTDFPGGNDTDMSRSLKLLAELPAETSVYPGHDRSTTIGAEPWLQRI